MQAGSGQTAANAVAELPSDPHALLAEAMPLYDFYDPALKPWHLKASYQLYDLKGNPAEQGTWEYWWASPKVRRSSWTRTGATRTDWWTAGGALYRIESGKPLRYFERTLETVLLSPLPPRGVLDSGRLKLVLKMIPEGQSKLACVGTTLQWEQNGKLQAPSSATPQYYCFEPSTLELRMTYSNSITAQFGQIVKTQGRYLARQVVISVGKQKVLSISVDKTDGIDPSDAMLSPASDAVLAHAVVSRPSSGQSDDNVTKGSLVKKTQPVYPMIAKMAHEQGVVVLGAVIGTDGRVHDVEVIASPSPVLADSAVDAVKKWEYKPYLLNGAAVEVETVVNVTYSLGS